MIREAYKLTLTHYAIDENLDKIKLDEPIVVEHIFDRQFGGSPIILNRMLDEMRAYVLNKIDEVENEID